MKKAIIQVKIRDDTDLEDIIYRLGDKYQFISMQIKKINTRKKWDLIYHSDFGEAVSWGIEDSVWLED